MLVAMESRSIKSIFVMLGIVVLPVAIGAVAYMAGLTRPIPPPSEETTEAEPGRVSDAPATGEASRLDMDSIQARLVHVERSAWDPQVRAEPAPRTASKFSGVPVLKKGESWPLCGHCKKPLQLFVQLQYQLVNQEF